MDSYRPEARHWRPDDDFDSYRPGRPDRDFGSQRPRTDANNNMYYFRGSRDEDMRRGPPPPSRSRYPNSRREPSKRYDSRGPPSAPRIATRPLLRLRDDAEDPSLLDPSAEFKFRNLDELTDSEEEVMALSDEENAERSSKRARLDMADSPTAPPVPKWSNPDPYTSLPPSGDTTAKRVDVVKLIRKARIDTTRAAGDATEADDFISFDMDEAETEQNPTEALVFPSMNPEPRWREVPVERGPVEGRVLGKRKRGESIGKPQLEMSAQNGVYADKMVRKEWAVEKDMYSTPWLTSVDLNDTPGVALHKEILDFHEWVRPKDFEERVRREVFQRLNHDFEKFMPGELKAFGSYAVGLYLPIADMDLVFLTRKFRPGTVPSKEESRRLVSNFARFLKQRQIARPGSVYAIRGAKVPIIKFIDSVSGLKVDLSFDNDSGLAAIETFQKWKQAYPAMPIISSVVKQYLMIRGLNDVATGGLGGFSIICLVTSLLQHLPAPKQPPNLGQVLVEFFNLYGNLFDRNAVVIRLDPPAYLDKSVHMPEDFKDKAGRLTIIDPNRADNNISGGTRLIEGIQTCFSLAHQALVQRLAEFERGTPQTKSPSFLECLVGGDFTKYRIQRQKLYELSAPGLNGTPYPGSTLPTPTTKKRDTDSPAHRPAKSDEVMTTNAAPDLSLNGDHNGSSSSAEKFLAALQGLPKSQKRAKRLKLLRPELASSIPKSISAKQLLSFGGYESQAEMVDDLTRREVAMLERTAKESE